ncbi:MAG: hypothetical protein ASARMPREDX12_006938 [Alectoria sarmentosa]|nr:MAG: hypothetical protein ASARMPREDX12_006938 [Alectoria sarmentosa]
MHGQPPLDDQTVPPFKADGVTRIPFTHQGHFFSPEFFICDHIFCRQEFELQFVAVLGLDYQKASLSREKGVPVKITYVLRESKHTYRTYLYILISNSLNMHDFIYKVCVDVAAAAVIASGKAILNASKKLPARPPDQRADALSKLGATSSGRPEIALLKIDPRGFGGILGRPLMEETKPLVLWNPDSACWESTQMEDGRAEGRDQIMVDATD